MKLLLALIFIYGGFARAEKCSGYISGADALTADYIAYLSTLVGERNILSLADLVAIAESPLDNPLVGNRSTVGLVHATELNLYLSEAGLNSDAISRWAIARIDEISARDGLRAPVIRATALNGRLGPMNFVKGGPFAWTADGETTRRISYPPGRARDVEIADFEIMATPFTQTMWFDEMGTMPSHSSTDPLRPVDSISFASVAELANRLSREAGLKAYYEIAQSSIESGDAAKGDLKVSSFILENPQANGFRVPKPEEYDYIVSGRGTGEEGMPPGIALADLYERMYIRANANGQSHAVGQRKPLFLDNQAFFDLLGNVSEYTGQGRHYSASFQDGLDQIIRHNYNSRLERTKAIGFRLARTLK